MSAASAEIGPADRGEGAIEVVQIAIALCCAFEFGNRVLRVAVNVTSDPWRVVTAFFDRSMRGEL